MSKVVLRAVESLEITVTSVVEAPPTTKMYPRVRTLHDFVSVHAGHVSINGTSIELPRFLDMVMHVLTSSNLAQNDPRLPFVSKVMALSAVEGYDGVGERLADA